MHSHSPVTSFETYKAGCLNPCCNGRCTRTGQKAPENKAVGNVLILVVMEDALAQERKIKFTVVRWLS